MAITIKALHFGPQAPHSLRVHNALLSGPFSIHIHWYLEFSAPKLLSHKHHGAQTVFSSCKKWIQQFLHWKGLIQKCASKTSNESLMNIKRKYDLYRRMIKQYPEGWKKMNLCWCTKTNSVCLRSAHLRSKNLVPINSRLPHHRRGGPLWPTTNDMQYPNIIFGSSTKTDQIYHSKRHKNIWQPITSEIMHLPSHVCEVKLSKWACLSNWTNTWIGDKEAWEYSWFLWHCTVPKWCTRSFTINSKWPSLVAAALCGSGGCTCQSFQGKQITELLPGLVPFCCDVDGSFDRSLEGLIVKLKRRPELPVGESCNLSGLTAAADATGPNI